MNKKILATILSGLMMVAFTGCGLKSPVETETTLKMETITVSEPEITLVYAEVNPLDTIVG